MGHWEGGVGLCGVDSGVVLPFEVLLLLHEAAV